MKIFFCIFVLIYIILTVNALIKMVIKSINGKADDFDKASIICFVFVGFLLVFSLCH